MCRRSWVLLAVLLAGLVAARPPISGQTEHRITRSVSGVKGNNRNTATGNGCKTYGDGGYECRHSYGYGDTDPFATGGSIDPNTITSSLTARDFGRDLVQAHVAGFEGDKNGCKTFPDGSYECRRGYSYSASTHGWDALQTDPLASSSLLNLHAVNQDLAALRDGNAVFDRNQNGCRTFPDGSWECKRSWGYGSSTETALNAGRGVDIGQDYSDVRGGTGSIDRDDKGCRSFTDGSWECRRGYSYSAATGWNLVSGDIPAPVSERRSSYNAQSATQSVQVNRNGNFDTTQRGCRTYADGSWECKPEWGYRSSGDVQTSRSEPNHRERENIRDQDRNVGSRTYSSTQERQEVFRNSGVSTPNVGVSTSSRGFDTTQRGCRTYADGSWECKPEWGYRASEDVQTSGTVQNPRERENIGDQDRNVGSRTYTSTQERQEVFRNSGGSTPNAGLSASLLGQDLTPDTQDGRGKLGETPTGCTTLPDGSTECRRGYSYSARQERNYTSGGGHLVAAIPSNREVASPRPTERPGVNAGRSSYSYTQERESIRNGGSVNPVVNVGLDTQVRENVAEVHSSRNRLDENPIRLSYTPQVINEPVAPNGGYQRPVNPAGNVARHEYSYTQERESIRNGGDINPVDGPTIGLSTYPRQTAPESHSYTVTTPRPTSYSGAVVNSQNRGRVYQEPKLGSVSRTSSYSQTQQREVINNAARPNSNPNNDGISTHGSEDFSAVSNTRVIPSYSRPSPTNTDRDYRTPVVDSGASGTRSYSYTQEKEVVNHGGIVNPTASRTVGLNSHQSSDLLGTTGSLGGSGCQTNPDGSTVCRRGYSHSSTQEREIYSGGSANNPLSGRSSDTILDHEEPGMVTVVTNPNARPNKEGCRTLPDGGTECLRGHSETRQWGHGVNAAVPIINPFNLDGSVNHLGGARLTNTQGGREVEGVKTGRRTSSSSSYSSSSQTHRVGGGVGSPAQNSGRYLNADVRQSAALQQGSGGGGNIAEVHSEEYAKSGSSGRGSGCAMVAGSPCSRNGQQSGYSFSSYGSNGFRTGTLEV